VLNGIGGPSWPIGLALLADACEAGHLDAELAMTLEDLAPLPKPCFMDHAR
jgi:hypothetical protein